MENTIIISVKHIHVTLTCSTSIVSESMREIDALNLLEGIYVMGVVVRKQFRFDETCAFAPVLVNQADPAQRGGVLQGHVLAVHEGHDGLGGIVVLGTDVESDVGVVSSLIDDIVDAFRGHLLVRGNYLLSAILKPIWNLETVLQYNFCSLTYFENCCLSTRCCRMG